MKQCLFTFIILIIAKFGCAQSFIEQSEDNYKFKINLDLSFGTKVSTTFQNIKYNYKEVDSLGKILVLGNLNSKNKPIGKWLFFLGDINLNGKDDWYGGNVKKGYLNGVWVYSYICTRIFNKGKEKNIGPCPNI